LDDLTPLHQLKDGVAEGGNYLFAPRPTLRTRTYDRAFWVAPAIDHVNYTNNNTSQVAFLAERAKDGSVVHHLLNAGANPPKGAVIKYYLAAPAKDVTLTILDADGNEVRSFTAADGVSTAAG